MIDTLCEMVFFRYFKSLKTELDKNNFNENCLSNIVNESEEECGFNDVTRSIINLIDEDFLKQNSWDDIFNRIKNLIVVYDKNYKCIKYNSSFAKFLNIEPNNPNINLYKFFNKNNEFPKESSCPIYFSGKRVNFYRSYCYIHNLKEIFWVYDIPIGDNESTTHKSRFQYILRVYVKIKKMNKTCSECLIKRGYNKNGE